MPIVHITLFQGRTPEIKEDLLRKVTNAIAASLKIPEEGVHIVLHDVPKENVAQGGIPATKDPKFKYPVSP